MSTAQFSFSQSSGTGELTAAQLDKQDTIPIEKVPDAPIPTKDELASSIRRGVDFLLKNQNKDGSWGDHTLTKGLNVLCPYPEGPRSFRLASTGLCIIGLLNCPYSDEPAVQQALERAVSYMEKTLPLLKRGDTQTVLSVWGHVYGLEALSMYAEKLPKDSEKYNALKKLSQLQMRALEQLADVQGGWGYYTFEVFTQRPIGMPTSFLTSTVLVAFKDAERAFGLKPNEKVLLRGLKSLKGQRTPAGNYVYSQPHVQVPGRLINRHTGSLARSPAGDLALIQYRPDWIAVSQMEGALERLWSRAGWLLLAVKKPIPHESFAQNSGYFFYYGYYYAARCLRYMPKERLTRHASHLAEDILPMQEKDGSWWDYPLYNYHKFYGTGYALYSLSMVWNSLYAQ